MKTPSTFHRPGRGSAGFSLVEVALSIGIGAFCLLSVMGLMPVGISSNQISITQVAASNVAAQIAADLRSTALTSGTSSLGFAVQPSGTTGATTQPQVLFFTQTGLSCGNVGDVPLASGTAAAFFRADVGLVPPSATNPKASTQVRVLVTWPAVANSSPQQLKSWPANYAGSFELVTALDRS